MTKKKETNVKVASLTDEDGLLKNAANGEMMHLTNNLRGAFIVPLQLLDERNYVDECILQPTRSIKVDKGLFNAQMKGNQAFRYLVDSGMVLAKKVVNLDARDLKNVEPCKPPKSLTGEMREGLENMQILEQAVTIKVSPGKPK